MNIIIRPFGFLGPKYRTDKIGAFLNYTSYLPAAIYLVLVYNERNPATTIESAALTILAMVVCIVPFLGCAILRSERVR